MPEDNVVEFKQSDKQVEDFVQVGAAIGPDAEALVQMDFTCLLCGEQFTGWQGRSAGGELERRVKGGRLLIENHLRTKHPLEFNNGDSNG